MKINARQLPRLNLCYLQRKAFQNHRKNIERIKSSLAGSHRLNHKVQKTQLYKEDQPNRFQSVGQETIRQTMEPKKTRNKKSSYELEKENNRLFQAIRNCSPTISIKQMHRHSLSNQKDLERMARFKTDPSSHHKVLKCKYSLQKIFVQEKKRDSQAASRFLAMSPPTTSKSCLEPMNSKAKILSVNSKRETSSRSWVTGQGRFKSLAYKNIERARSLYEQKGFQLITEQKLDGFREKGESGQSRMHVPQIHKWKTRCFTTQLQAHE